MSQVRSVKAPRSWKIKPRHEVGGGESGVTDLSTRRRRRLASRTSPHARRNSQSQSCSGGVAGDLEHSGSWSHRTASVTRHGFLVERLVHGSTRAGHLFNLFTLFFAEPRRRRSSTTTTAIRTPPIPNTMAAIRIMLKRRLPTLWARSASSSACWAVSRADCTCPRSVSARVIALIECGHEQVGQSCRSSLSRTLNSSQGRANAAFCRVAAYANLLRRVVAEHLLEEGRSLRRQLPRFGNCGAAIHSHE